MTTLPTFILGLSWLSLTVAWVLMTLDFKGVTDYVDPLWFAILLGFGYVLLSVSIVLSWLT